MTKTVHFDLNVTVQDDVGVNTLAEMADILLNEFTDMEDDQLPYGLVSFDGLDPVEEDA